MLQAIREKTSGWIAYVIIGLISIPFALWGVNSYLGGGEQQPAAIVDGDEISVRQLDYAYARYRERLSSVFGGQLPDMFNNELTLKDQVLTQLIEEKALNNYAHDSGFGIGDSRLFETIRTMPVFQQDGQFSSEAYQNQLASQGYSATLFEQELRQSLLMQQIDKGIKTSAFLVPREQDRFRQLNNQKRSLSIVTLVNDVQGQTVSDSEIEEYFEQQAGRYMNPAQVKIDYIELSIDKLKDSIDIEESQLVDRYEQNRDQLTTPEIRQASHILLKVAEGDDEEAVKQQLQDIRNRIIDGGDFAALAKEFSQDPGSAADGGDLGDVEREMMVKPFETALFDLDEGDISEAVKTQFGWHLIKLHKISGGDTPTLDQARFELEAEIKTEMAEGQIYDLAESLANIGYEQPDSLLPAAEQLGLEVQTSEWFSRSQGRGVATDDQIRQIAFSDDVLNQNRNSELIELGSNRVVMIHLNEHKEASRKSLDEVRDEVVDAVKGKKGRELTLNSGTALLERVKAGESLQDVARELGIEVVETGLIERNAPSVDRDIVSTAFSMKKPQDSQPEYEGIAEADGDYSIIALNEVAEGDSAEGAETPVNDTFRSSLGTTEYQSFLQWLTGQASVSRTPVSELQ